MIYSDRPIGIFDSGIGGLSVAAAIKKRLPTENLIYFGDTAHLPYGDKSPETIKLYSRRISNFLLGKQCKALVIACNSASSVAYAALERDYGQLMPIVNVIDPTIEYLLTKGSYRNIGIIGTRATINSGVYQRKIKEFDSSIKVASLATPLLVPMIEEGFFNNSISKSIIETYLADPALKDIDCLILACTHYPLIKNQINAYYTNSIAVIDSAEWVASRLAGILESKQLLSHNGGNSHHFYISDLTPSFEKSAQVFFGKEIHLELVKQLV